MKLLKKSDHCCSPVLSSCPSMCLEHPYMQWRLPKNLFSHSPCQCAYLLFFKNMAIFAWKNRAENLFCLCQLTSDWSFMGSITGGFGRVLPSQRAPQTQETALNEGARCARTADYCEQKTFAHTLGGWGWVQDYKFCKAIASFSFLGFGCVNINPERSSWWLGNEEL